VEDSLSAHVAQVRESGSRILKKQRASKILLGARPAFRNVLSQL